MKLSLAVCIPPVLLWSATGCASRSYAPLEANVESMRSVRQSLEETNAQADRALASLQKVVAWADRDPRPAFDEFEDDFEKLEELAKESIDRTKAMTEASEQYFQSWNAENAGMKTSELQELSTERMSIARESWRNVQERAMDMDEAFQDYLDRLRELRGYIANNLSPAGIEAARPFVERAERSGKVLEERITDMMSGLDRMTARVAPAGAGA